MVGHVGHLPIIITRRKTEESAFDLRQEQDNFFPPNSTQIDPATLQVFYPTCNTYSWELYKRSAILEEGCVS